MPKKIRDLKSRLLRAGFLFRKGKGSHTVWYHPRLPRWSFTLSGKDGADAKDYQEDRVRKALRRLGEDL